MSVLREASMALYLFAFFLAPSLAEAQGAAEAEILHERCPGLNVDGYWLNINGGLFQVTKDDCRVEVIETNLSDRYEIMLDGTTRSEIELNAPPPTARALSRLELINGLDIKSIRFSGGRHTSPSSAEVDVSGSLTLSAFGLDFFEVDLDFHGTLLVDVRESRIVASRESNGAELMTFKRVLEVKLSKVEVESRKDRAMMYFSAGVNSVLRYANSLVERGTLQTLVKVE